MIHKLIMSLTDWNGGDPPKEVHIPGYDGPPEVKGVAVRSGSVLVLWPENKKWVSSWTGYMLGHSFGEVTPEMVVRYEQQREIKALELISDYARRK